MLIRFETMLVAHSASDEKCIAADVSTDFNGFSLIFIDFPVTVNENISKSIEIHRNPLKCIEIHRKSTET